MRWLFVVAMLSACGSPPPASSVSQPEPRVREPSPPPELAAMIAARDRLCACADVACADAAYEASSAVIGERDLGGWSDAQRALFHQARWAAEDCNLALLAGGDPEVLEHAREALRDRVAAAAPELIEQIYQRARALHAGGAALPPSSAAPTPAPGSCCRWSDGLCRPSPGWWQEPPWSALGFAVDEPQAYSLSYQRSGDTEVLVTAIGDIDCDGSYGTFELRGDVSRQASGLIRITDHLD